MKTIRIAFALLLTTAAAYAQQTQPAQDYSKDTLIRVLAASSETEEQQRIRFRDGAVEFRALGLDWRFPTVVAPLVGSVRDDVSSLAWPDAMATLGIPLATGAHLVRNGSSRRDVVSELRRIEREERRMRERTRVVVNP